MIKLAILLGLFCIGWFTGYATRVWIEQGENERLKAMYEAAKGDLKDSLRGHSELADEFFEVCKELKDVKNV